MQTDSEISTGKITCPCVNLASSPTELGWQCSNILFWCKLWAISYSFSSLVSKWILFRQVGFKKTWALGSNISHSVGCNTLASSETFCFYSARGLYHFLGADYQTNATQLSVTSKFETMKHPPERTKYYHKLHLCSAPKFWAFIVMTLRPKLVPKSKHSGAHRVLHQGKRPRKSITCDRH